MIESKRNTLKMTAIVVAITIVSNVLVTLAGTNLEYDCGMLDLEIE
jgi:hypothetical protein